MNTTALNRIGMSLLFLCVFAPLRESQVADSKQPNMVFILVDDQGYCDLGCYGATE